MSFNYFGSEVEITNISYTNITYIGEIRLMRAPFLGNYIIVRKPV